MEKRKLIRKLFKLFPTKIAKKYHDYVGKMVPSTRTEISTIVTCLDVTKAVVETAIKNNADLIISHHPFIYGKKKIVLLDDYKNSLYQELLNHNIEVYSFHTNFDEGKGGMNDTLAKQLGLQNIEVIENLPIGRKGELLMEMEIHQFAKEAYQKLNVSHGLLLNFGKKMIKTVGIVGGAGARDCFEAYNDNVDLFISGDTPYHIRREIIDKEKNYLHLDHEIERICISRFKEILLDIDSSLNIIECDDIVECELIL